MKKNFAKERTLKNSRKISHTANRRKSCMNNKCKIQGDSHCLKPKSEMKWKRKIWFKRGREGSLWSHPRTIIARFYLGKFSAWAVSFQHNHQARWKNVETKKECAFRKRKRNPPPNTPTSLGLSLKAHLHYSDIYIYISNTKIADFSVYDASLILLSGNRMHDGGIKYCSFWQNSNSMTPISNFKLELQSNDHTAYA